MNFLSGSGSVVGDALVENEHVKAVSFTGSCDVGNAVHAKASARRIRIQLEMGGKNPTIVLADADMASAVANSLNAAMGSTGQKCTATSRVIIEESIYEEFAERFIAATKALKVGNGLEDGVQIGPAIDKGQLEVDDKYCRIAEEEGATIACGGNILKGGAYDKRLLLRAHRGDQRDQ